VRTQVQKWGNSLAIRIPKAFARDLGIERDRAVELTVEDGALVLRPTAIPKYELSQLLEHVTESNLHSETSWGAPGGLEAW